MSPLYNTSRDDFAPLWAHFELDPDRIHVIDAADPGQDRPAKQRGGGHVLVAQVGYSPDVALAVKTYQLRGEPALAADGAAMVYLTDARPDEEIARYEGANAYLTKPFDPVELVDLVEELVAGRRRIA